MATRKVAPRDARPENARVQGGREQRTEKEIDKDINIFNGDGCTRRLNSMLSFLFSSDNR